MFPLLPEIFRWNDLKRCVAFILLSKRISFRQFFVNGKQPLLYVGSSNLSPEADGSLILPSLHSLSIPISSLGV